LGRVHSIARKGGREERGKEKKSKGCGGAEKLKHERGGGGCHGLGKKLLQLSPKRSGRSGGKDRKQLSENSSPV